MAGRTLIPTFSLGRRSLFHHRGHRAHREIEYYCRNAGNFKLYVLFGIGSVKKFVKRRTHDCEWFVVCPKNPHPNLSPRGKEQTLSSRVIPSPSGEGRVRSLCSFNPIFSLPLRAARHERGVLDKSQSPFCQTQYSSTLDRISRGQDWSKIQLERYFAPGRN